MTVVADTSAICYAILIGCEDLLPKLFGRVHIPQAVRAELSAAGAPQRVLAWMQNPPEWLVVETVHGGGDADLVRLDRGERETLLLASELRAEVVLLDEKAARQVAAARGLLVTGLLGIFSEAAALGIVDLPGAVERLRQTNFRASPAMLRDLLLRHVGKSPEP